MLVVVALSSPLARAQSAADLVGTWYLESKESGSIGGIAYDIRRAILSNRSDGTKTNISRFYSDGKALAQADGKALAEVIETYSWGVDNGIYWTVCQTVMSSSRSITCSSRAEYEIVSVNARETRYKSKRTGTTYTLLRVADDFRLP